MRQKQEKWVNYPSQIYMKNSQFWKVEEYYILIQMQILKHLTKEINERYNVNLDDVKSVFESIIRDENHHLEIIGTLKQLAEPLEKDLDNTPAVRYQSPDNWRNYTSFNIP